MRLPPDIILVLFDEHNALLGALDTYKNHQDGLQRFSSQWAVHRQLAWEVILPALRRSSLRGEAEASRAQAAHAQVDDAVASLQEDVSDEVAMERFKQLRRSLNHHVSHVEMRIVPELRRATSVRSRQLAKQYQARKEALMATVTDHAP